MYRILPLNSKERLRTCTYSCTREKTTFYDGRRRCRGTLLFESPRESPQEVNSSIMRIESLR